MNVRFCLFFIALVIAGEVASTKVHRRHQSKRSSPGDADDFPSFEEWKKNKLAEKTGSSSHSSVHHGHYSHDDAPRSDSHDEGRERHFPKDMLPTQGASSFHQTIKKGVVDARVHDSPSTPKAPVRAARATFDATSVEDDDSEVWDTFQPDDSYISRMMAEFLTVRRPVTEASCNANAGPKDFCLCTVGRSENFACDFDCSCLDGMCEARACNLTGRFIGIFLIGAICLFVAPISFYLSKVLAETPPKGQPIMDFEAEWQQGMHQSEAPAFPSSKVVSDW
jgi:hypothetical protein